MLYQPENDFKPEEILEYLRKSRTDDPLLTVEEVLERHETILNEWAERHIGSKVPAENVFREVVSGETIDSRPELLKLLKKIESPKIKAILIVEVQRLGRPDLEDIGRLSKLFRYTNTLVITPTKTFDLRNEYDREAFERELMRGNEYLEYSKKIMSRGRLLSVQQGNFIGTKPPYGYEKDTIVEGKKKCHTLKVKEDEANVVRMIFDMYVNQNMGCTKIAHKLNDLGVPTRTGTLWKHDTIIKMLNNEHYIGKVRWNWRKTLTIVEDGEFKKVRPQNKVGEYLVYDGKHEAIISDELFQRAREKHGKNYKAKTSSEKRNPLAGMLYCQCGRAMSYKMYGGGGYGNQKAAPRYLCDNQRYCKTSSCLVTELMDEIRDVLKGSIDNYEIFIANDDKTSKQLHENMIQRLKSRMIEVEKKELSQWEKYTSDEMPKEIFDKLNAKVLAEKEEIQQSLCKAYESLPDPVDYEEELIKFQRALAAIDDPDATVEEQHELFRACFEKITYHREQSVRIQSQQVRYYDKEQKRTRYKSPLSTGSNWTKPDIHLDVDLLVPIPEDKRKLLEDAIEN